MPVKESLKTWAKRLVGDYEINRIYHSPPQRLAPPLPPGLVFATVGPQEVAEAEDAEVRRHAWYAQCPGHHFGLWENGALVCFCSHWTKAGGMLPPRLKDIAEDEIALVDVITAEQARGKGYSGLLINLSLGELQRLGYRRAWAWIWHSNHPSIRAFEKAGWIYERFLVELPLFGEKDRIRLRLPRLLGRLAGR